MQTHSILLENSFKLYFISVIQVINFLSSERQISKFRSQDTGGYIRLHSRRNSADCRLLLRTLALSYALSIDSSCSSSFSFFLGFPIAGFVCSQLSPGRFFLPGFLTMASTCKQCGTKRISFS